MQGYLKNIPKIMKIIPLKFILKEKTYTNITESLSQNNIASAKHIICKGVYLKWLTVQTKV